MNRNSTVRSSEDTSPTRKRVHSLSFAVRMHSLRSFEVALFVGWASSPSEPVTTDAIHQSGLANFAERSGGTLLERPFWFACPSRNGAVRCAKFARHLEFAKSLVTGSDGLEAHPTIEIAQLQDAPASAFLDDRAGGMHSLARRACICGAAHRCKFDSRNTV